MKQGSDQIEDQALNKYLQGDSALSQAYAAVPQIEPPDHLDAAILAEAHRAVGAAPGGKKKHHWNFPLSMVATLFVVVMVGLLLPDMLQDASVSHDLQQSKVAAVNEQQVAEATLPAPAVEAPGSVVPGAVTPLAKKMAAPEPAPAATMQRKAEILPAPSAADNYRAGDVAGVVASKPATANMAPAAPAARSVQLSGAASERIQAQQIMEGEERKAAAKEKRATSKAEAPAPVAAMEAAPSALMDEALPENLPAAEWLKRIQKLKQEGKLEEVKKELAAFRKKYPDYAIPKELNLP